MGLPALAFSLSSERVLFPDMSISSKPRLQLISLALIGSITLSGCVAIDPKIVDEIAQSENSGSDLFSCGGGGSKTGLTATGSVNNLTEEQNETIRLLLGAAKERKGVDDDDRHKLAVILLITSFQESSFRNIGYGDEAQGVKNPDGSATTSVGTFQQQDWWGPRADRMDVKKSANLFMDRLLQFNWKGMEEGAAAQRVQASAHPGAYSNHIGFAEEIIKKMGDDYKELSGSSSSSGSSGSCKEGKASGQAGKGDDYPKNLHADAASIADGFDPDLDPWGLYVGQCVSYVAWRLNQQMGWKESQPYPFTMAKMGMAGKGNGYQWSSGLAAKGYKTDKIPKKGAVAWWDANANEYVGGMGHVAIVESYDMDARTVTVSQYNMQPKPLQYSEHTFPLDKISGLIHVADTE